MTSAACRFSAATRAATERSSSSLESVSRCWKRSWKVSFMRYPPGGALELRGGVYTRVIGGLWEPRAHTESARNEKECERRWCTRLGGKERTRRLPGFTWVGTTACIPEKLSSTFSRAF